jgi:hypothetical protein
VRQQLIYRRTSLRTALVAGKQASIIFTTLRDQLFTRESFDGTRPEINSNNSDSCRRTYTILSIIMALSTPNPEHLHGLVDMGR